MPEKTSERLDAAVMESGEQLLSFFAFNHLNPRLQAVSAIFADAAVQVVGTIPKCAERTVALRKLLEGKDAAVRAAL